MSGDTQLRLKLLQSAGANLVMAFRNVTEGLTTTNHNSVVIICNYYSIVIIRAIFIVINHNSYTVIPEGTAL